MMNETSIGRADVPRRTSARWERELWLRWVGANAAGELLGLGGVALVGLGLAATLDGASRSTTLGLAAVVILAGVLIEGVVVGTAQWLVLRHVVPGVVWRAWVLATAAGAGVAWTLGMVPSTLMAGGTDASGASPSEMGNLVQFGLAVMMGLVLGPILGVPQWLVLRRAVARAGWWVPANALAWACGMPLVFAGAGTISAGMGPLGVAAIVALILVAAGAAVGAGHGLALVLLAREPHTA